MKWLLRIIGAIFILFTAICTYGYLLPDRQSIETSIIVNAYAEDVFPFLNDLTIYNRWSSLHAKIEDAQIIYGGADAGVGQTMAWQNGAGEYPFGSQEIVQSQPGEFVRLDVSLAGRATTTTYAVLSMSDSDDVTVLSKSEIALHGFPYLDRVRSKLQMRGYRAEYEAALARLKVIAETSKSE